jgi:exodeoxyribonuclease V beta subunit
LDAAKVPLDMGVTRIEASAGTGKTYALCALFLRLIAEANLEVGSILVTTFTIPATAELRERIRSLLLGAAAMFDDGPGDHPLLKALHSRYTADAAEIRPRIGRALRQFDDAAICTIHGFCHRLLRERAFESGVPFDAEPIEDQSAMLLEVAMDFWRQRTYPAGPRIGAMAMIENLGAGNLTPLLAKCVARPAMHILPPWDAAALADAETEMLAAFSAVESAWKGGETSLRALFADPKSWSAVKDMAKTEITEAKIDALGRCIADSAAILEDYKALDFFTTESVKKQTGARGKKKPEHPIFGACSQFVAARARWGTAFQREFLAWAPEQLSARKLQRNALSFDDLLVRLRDALRSRSGSALVDATRKRFAAALVDEFQDTDPVQAEIFQRLFDGHGRLYFIGDPKQAIYGFRGADVFSYLDAVEKAQFSHELSTNQRSVTPLVEAVNAIFDHSPSPFVVEKIEFHDAFSAGRRDAEALGEDGALEPVFKFWLWSEDKPIAKGAAEARLPRVVADAIIQQLATGVKKDGRRLQPSDFAVLTASNKQAQHVQVALSSAGLPAVVLSNASVFGSDEAGEMLAILQALACPGDEGAVRAALTTTALDLTAAKLAECADDATTWERLLERFHLHHARWVNDGFFPAMRELLTTWRVRPRLLRLPDGERRLTNLLQLAELLHHAAATQRLGPAALARWLATELNAETPASEEHELRLESDDNAVKVVTVHKSKGLEFGIVWCPFSWDKATLREDEAITFHDETTRALALDLGTADYAKHRAVLQRERLAEHARLLYVALTRAKLQCHFVWGSFNKCKVSAASWILHPPASEGGDPVAALEARELDDAQLRAGIEEIVQKVPGAFAVADVPDAVGARYLPPAAASAPRAARSFSGAIRRDWAIGSFTSLTAGMDAEQRDYDSSAAPAEPAVVATGIHAFPKGRRAGTCLHEIFETLDFTDDTAIEPLIARKLAVFGFDRPEFREAAVDCVRRTLATELSAGLRLADVPKSARLNELEFHLPVGRLDSRRLADVLGEQLSFAAFSGFLKGFIDLVFEHDGHFYIIDWKSNWLGTTADDYTPEAIAAEMRRHHYTVQYQLYCVALHRYLVQRLGEGYDFARHFGGVFYIFLRGIDPARPELGVLRDRPTLDRINALDTLLFTP